MFILFLQKFRWTAIAWPHKIERQMEATYTQLEEDEERFRKLQTSDQANFNDRLDTLQVSANVSHIYILLIVLSCIRSLILAFELSHILQ